MKARTRGTPGDLLEELAWVRGLARRLCADAASADDLSQEVMLAGMANPPRPEVPVRRWLAAIARRKARMAARGAGRRAYHEAGASAEGESPDTAELLLRLEEHRRVADAVARLREPYRTVLLLRYFEDLTPVQIARRGEESLSTVKTRLARGLALLRQELERARGPGWLAALLPLAKASEDAVKVVPAASFHASTTSWVGIMTAKHVSLASIVLLMAWVGFMAWGRGGGVSGLEPARSLVGAEVVSPEKADLVAVPESGPDAARLSTTQAEPGASMGTADPEPGPDEAADVDPSTTQTALHVIARTPFGDPLAGVLMEWVTHLEVGEASVVPERHQDLGRTDATGALDAVVPRVHSSIRVKDPKLVQVVEGVLTPFNGETATAIVIAGHARVVTGTVVDLAGAPVPGASVTLICNEDFSARFGEVVGMQNVHLQTLTAAADGRFEFPVAPEAPASMVKAEAAGFEYLMEDLPDHGDASVVLRLSPVEPGVTVLRGRVVCADGASADGARVAVSPTGMSTLVEEGTGAFEIPIGGGEASVQAVLPGFLPARLQKSDGEAWPKDVVLILGSPALEIRGRVVDETGAPLAGIHVGVMDGSDFGAVPEPGLNSWKSKRMEDLASATGAATAVTSLDGTFRIDGLEARTYRVLAHEPERLRGTVTTVEAGQHGVEIVVDGRARTGSIRGSVMDRQGQPLSGVIVRAFRTFGIDDHYNREANDLAGASTITGADGRFSISPVALLDVQLTAYGGRDFEYYAAALSDFEDPGALKIELTRNARFRIEWSSGKPPEGARTLSLQAPDGSVVTMYRDYEGGTIVLGEVWLTDPSTPVLFAAEGRYEAVLAGEDGEVERFPLDLQGSGTQVLRR